MNPQPNHSCTIELPISTIYTWVGALCASGNLSMDRRAQIVKSALEADFRRAWDNQSLAQLVNLSESRFRHLFKAEWARHLHST